MNEKKHPGQSEGLGLGDIYFVLFRHKRKIILLSLASLLAAGSIRAFMPVLYTSQAELLVRYIVESRLSRVPGGDSQVRVPDSRGENIINSEVEILTSLDLARQVVSNLGADKILAKAGGGNNPLQAASLIKRNIAVEPVRRSDVLRINYQHPDRDLVQSILSQLIACYMKRHGEIHRNLGLSDEFLAQRTLSLSNQLARTEAELRTARSKAGVVSFEDEKKTCSARIARLRESLLTAEADLGQHEAALKAVARFMPVLDAGSTNKPLDAPPDKVVEYQRMTARLAALARRVEELSNQYTESSGPVTEVRQQMAEAERLKKALEETYPALAMLPPTVPGTTGQPSIAAVDPAGEAIQVGAFKSRIEILKAQLAQVHAEGTKLEEMEGAIVELQRKRELEEAEYRYFSSSLAQARFNEALEAGKLSNITVTQEPSPPFRDVEKLRKLQLMVVVGGVLGSIALAFLIEFFLDQTLKRPAEVEAKLHLPLFLTIPDTGRNGLKVPETPAPERRLLKAPEGSTPPAESGEPATGQKGEVALWDTNHRLHLFFEALRHNLVTFFEDNNLRHKPKLVAVTACATGAGVTTIAAGLAATLSETSDGNVLLVDMNKAHGVAHPFHRGKPGCGLVDALERKIRESALVHENLHIVSEEPNSDKLLEISKTFTHLVPQLRASDYDYVIFDMPPVSQISVTSKLSRLMDINLLVVEAEKNNRDLVKQASNMLSGPKANVGVVLNKKRTYVPKWLLQELGH